MSFLSDHFTQIARRLDPQSALLRAWALTGGIAAQMTALEIALPDGQTRKLIVRQPGVASTERRPQAADEFRLLHVLRAAGLNVPTPYDLDESGTILPMPYLVIEYIEGQVELAPVDAADCARQMASQLAAIHRLDTATLDLSFLPTQTAGLGARRANMTPAEAQIRATLESVGLLLPLNRPALLHGDYWPGNVLWRDGQLVAVIDWEECFLGDPLADVAQTRLDVLFVFGAPFMEQFTQQYQAANPIDFTHLPYWDLRAALRAAPYFEEWASVYPPLGRPGITPQTMQAAHAWFVQQIGDI